MEKSQRVSRKSAAMNLGSTPDSRYIFPKTLGSITANTSTFISTFSRRLLILLEVGAGVNSKVCIVWRSSGYDLGIMILRQPGILHCGSKPSTFYYRPLFHGKQESILQSRTFFDSILSSALGPCPLRTVSHTKLLPYSPKVVFKAVSDVSGYPTFLPFTISSHVTSRDPDGYPTRARLKIGYEKLGLEEDWDSIVFCDPKKGLVEARSSDENSNGLFEILNTRWHISHREGGDEDHASVKLDVNVKFRNPVYDQLFSQVEGKVASTMISAFEKRVEELHQRKTD